MNTFLALQRVEAVVVDGVRKRMHKAVGFETGRAVLQAYEAVVILRVQKISVILVRYEHIKLCLEAVFFIFMSAFQSRIDLHFDENTWIFILNCVLCEWLVKNYMRSISDLTHIELRLSQIKHRNAHVGRHDKIFAPRLTNVIRG